MGNSNPKAKAKKQKNPTKNVTELIDAKYYND